MKNLFVDNDGVDCKNGGECSHKIGELREGVYTCGHCASGFRGDTGPDAQCIKLEALVSLFDDGCAKVPVPATAAACEAAGCSFNSNRAVCTSNAVSILSSSLSIILLAAVFVSCILVAVVAARAGLHPSRKVLRLLDQIACVIL